MIILDTSVLSELLGPSPAKAVELWLAEQPQESVFISTVTEAELRFGLTLLPQGKIRSAVLQAIEDMLDEDFEGRILPFDSVAASSFAMIASDRGVAGRPISYAGAQIAAIARSRGAAVATLNAPDFEGCGIRVVDPWTTKAP